MNIICKLEYSPVSETFTPLLYIGGVWEPEHNIWGERVEYWHMYPKQAGLHCVYVNRNGLPK